MRTYASIIHQDDRQEIFNSVQEGLKEKRQCKLDYRIVHSDGSIRWINENVQGVFNNKGELLYLIGITNDVTQLKQAEEALKESEEKYRQVFNYAPLGVVHIDSNGEITDCNDNFVEIIGSSREELIGLDTLNLQDKRIVRRITDALQGKLTTFEGDYHSTTAVKVTPARVLFAPIKSDDENVVGVIGIVEDIAERKKAEEKIRYMGFHDTLTGLYNRAFLEEEMRRLDTERQLPISIIMADLNGLKLVNDTYGHAKGDEMLKRTAEILRKPCREEDIIARWGGDEFVILIPQTRGEEANKICKRIMKSCKSAYVNDVPISIALGFACKDSSEKELSQVLREAEDNMYQHKLTEDRSAKNAVLKALLKTLAEKSFETEGHVFNMQRIAQVIGQKLDLPDSELSRLELIITLHDIGKINISEEVLTKEGPLTREEWEIIKRHPEIGYRIARATAEFAHVAEDILAHHERWDGSGYPRGLKGKDIPLLARITAIADAYEVMRYGRPYKKAMDKSEIIEEFKRCSASQFDPELVAIFLSILAEGKID